jgi:hypothetical protein
MPEEALMSEQDSRTNNGAVRFNEREADALRDIVTDWVNEQIVSPPFPAEVTSIIEKLDIASQIEVPETVSPPRNFQNEA